MPYHNETTLNTFTHHDNSNNQGSNANQIDLLREKFFDLAVTALETGRMDFLGSNSTVPLNKINMLCTFSP